LTSGCEASDFEGFRSGNVALLRRGVCPFGQNVENAEAAGSAVGEELARLAGDGGATVRVVASTRSENR
jgi:hypothetical protein